jgi:hypothetical protein
MIWKNAAGIEQFTWGTLSLKKQKRLVDSMQMRELMWEMFRSTGHIGAYLLYKEYDNEGFAPDFEFKENEVFQQKLPVS